MQALWCKIEGLNSEIGGKNYILRIVPQYLSSLQIMHKLRCILCFCHVGVLSNQILQNYAEIRKVSNHKRFLSQFCKLTLRNPLKCNNFFSKSFPCLDATRN